MAGQEMRLDPPAGMHLGGAALESWRQGELRRRLAEQHLAEFQALARGLSMLACKVTGLPGPDALRAVLGRDDALKVLRLAGHNVEAIAGNWDAMAPVQRQVSSGLDHGYERDPDHDPRVLAVITRPDATMAEIAAAREQVTAEYADAAARRARESRQAAEVMWTLRDGSEYVSSGHLPPGAAATEGGAPAQRSAVARDWDSFADHQAIPQARADMGALEIALLQQQLTPPRPEPCTAHTGPGPYCRDCGTRFGEEVAG